MINKNKNKVLIAYKYSHTKIEPKILETIAELFVEDNWEKVIEIYLGHYEKKDPINQVQNLVV